MKIIQELIGTEATKRLKKRYGTLVDIISVEEKGKEVLSRIFKMELQILTRKKVSKNAAKREMEDAMGVGLAEIEHALYSVLNFDGRNMEQGFHFNNDLPRNGIHMHREIYKELMESERESMRRIETRLEQSNERKKRGDVDR